jgi:RyR domain
MRLTDEDIARVVHAANNALQGIVGDPWASPPWPAAENWRREAKINSVRAVREAVGELTPEMIHDEWMRWYTAHGWVYGPIKDDVLKTHPCMVPFHELPEEQQVKDALFLAIVRVFQGQRRELLTGRHPRRDGATAALHD